MAETKPLERAKQEFLFPNAVRVTVEAPDQDTANRISLEIQRALFGQPASSRPFAQD